MEHELSHLRRHDNLTFVLHMIGQAIFWFYPLMWWLGKRLIAERERACDEAVLRAGHDPDTYAKSILKVCKFHKQSPLPCAAGVAGSDLKMRVVEIMAARVQTVLSPAKKTLLLCCGMSSIVSPLIVGALTIGPAIAQPDRQEQPGPAALDQTNADQLRYEQSRPRTVIPLDPKEFEKYVGYYEIFPSVFIHVYQKGGHFFSQLTGQGPVEWFPESPSKFFATVVAAQISFVIQPDGRVTGLISHQDGRLEPATRVDEAFANKADSELQRRIKDDIASPGTEAALRHQIETLQRGVPDYTSMSPALVQATREQLSEIKELFGKIGDLNSLRFSKVLPNGSDLYVAVFSHGQLECTIAPLSRDGKVMGEFFHLLP